MSEPTPGPTDADVEAMAIGMALNAPWEDAHKRWKDVSEHEKVVLRAGARAALMALPHYLRAVEEREGLIEALRIIQTACQIPPHKLTDTEFLRASCNIAFSQASAILSRAQAPTPEEG